MLIVDNLDNSQNDALPTFHGSAFNLLDTCHTNSVPSKPISTGYTNSKPDILTHGNQTVKFCLSEETNQNQTPITDKRTTSSLYVDMTHDSVTLDLQSDNYFDDLNEDSEKIIAVPVFVSLERVPINIVQSNVDITEWNESQEIRLGIEHISLVNLKFQVIQYQ